MRTTVDADQGLAHRLWKQRHSLITSFGVGTGRDRARPKGLLRRAVLGGFLHETLEERHVLPGLRVPQDAQGKAARRVLQGFDRAVGGACRFAQARPELPEALMVVRLHVMSVAQDR